MMSSILDELNCAIDYYKPLILNCKYCECKPIIVYNQDYLNFNSCSNDIIIKIIDTNYDCQHQISIAQVLSQYELIRCSDPRALIHQALEELAYEWNDNQLK